jgi:hypothetical protein
MCDSKKWQQDVLEPVDRYATRPSSLSPVRSAGGNNDKVLMASGARPLSHARIEEALESQMGHEPSAGLSRAHEPSAGLSRARVRSRPTSQRTPTKLDGVSPALSKCKVCEAGLGRTTHCCTDSTKEVEAAASRGVPQRASSAVAKAMAAGQPATNLDLCTELKEVLYLFDEEQIFKAGEILRRIDAHVAQLGAATPPNVRALMEREGAKLQVARERAAKCTIALDEFNKTDGWKLSTENFGTKVFWKPGDGDTIWVKIDGEIKGPNVLDSLAVIKECDLWHTWVPFCNQSSCLKELGRVELLAHMTISIPMLKRDAVVHGFGVDMTEDGMLLVLSESVDSFPGVEIPPAKGCKRMEFNGFKCLIKPLGRNRLRNCIIVNVDPKAPLPQSMVQFFLRKFAGVLLYFWAKAARKIQTHPEKSEIAKRMKERGDFYKDWLQPKIEEYFKRNGM